jgi:putative transposase
VITSTAFVIGLVLVIVLGLDPNTQLRKAAFTGRILWDNAAMESFFSSMKIERTERKTYRTRDQAKADVFDYIERFYNPRRRHSTVGYLSPIEFERQALLA